MATAAFSTCDLCDAHAEALESGEIGVVAAPLLAFGTRTAFFGPAVTLKVFEDNSLVAEAVRQPGERRVLVVDGGASRRCALLGGNLAAAAASNGWAGVVIDGAIRDVDEIDALAIGVRAVALSPRRSTKLGAGQRDVAIAPFGVAVVPGSWIYADRDGLIVSRRPLHAGG